MIRSNCGKLLVIGLFFSPFAWSQSVSVDAHEHGKAELMIAVEGENIEIQLLSPAANMLGFEQAPSTTAQEEKILEVNNILTDVEPLFQFKGSACQPTSQTVEVPYSAKNSAKNSDENSAKKVTEADHDNELEEEEEHHHHADEHEDNQHSESHSEVLANYLFSCDGGVVTEIQVLFLTQFPGIELLEVQWITEAKQGAQELSANQSWIDLR